MRGAVVFAETANGYRSAHVVGPLGYGRTQVRVDERGLVAEQVLTGELREAERRPQARLAGDVAALDQSLDERLIFTFGPDGECYTKQDDLQPHRSRQQVLTKVMEEDLIVLVEGRSGVTWFLGALEGTVAGAPFAARMRYTRTWIHDEDHGWRIVLAHASAV